MPRIACIPKRYAAGGPGAESYIRKVWGFHDALQEATQISDATAALEEQARRAKELSNTPETTEAFNRAEGDWFTAAINVMTAEIDLERAIIEEYGEGPPPPNWLTSATYGHTPMVPAPLPPAYVPVYGDGWQDDRYIAVQMASMLSDAAEAAWAAANGQLGLGYPPPMPPDCDKP